MMFAVAICTHYHTFFSFYQKLFSRSPLRSPQCDIKIFIVAFMVEIQASRMVLWALAAFLPHFLKQPKFNFSLAFSKSPVGRFPTIRSFLPSPFCFPATFPALIFESIWRFRHSAKFVRTFYNFAFSTLFVHVLFILRNLKIRGKKEVVML